LVEARDYQTMSSIGADRRQLALLSTARNATVGLVGAIGAVVVALFLSPIAPLGEARIAENSSGIHFDLFVLPLGGLATFFVVMGLGLYPSWRTARSSSGESKTGAQRSSTTVSRLSALGAPPAMIIGVRNALERKSEGASVPVGSAVLGTVLAVTALCATAVFGASLTHLTTTPRLYGVPFQLNLSNPSAFGPPENVLKQISANPEVSALTTGIASQVEVNGQTVGGVIARDIEGPLQFSLVNGSAPGQHAEIGLGEETMKQTGAHVGGTVALTILTPTGAARTTTFRVVSQVVFPVLSGIVGLGRGALMTTAAYQAAVCPPGPAHSRCASALSQSFFAGGTLIGVAAGPGGQQTVRDLLAKYGSSITIPTIPTALVNFGQAVNFPLIFGIILAAFGAATLAHLLVVSVARRRREVGLLKALGFVNAQVRSAVAWQATCLACIGLVIGVPLGIGLGIVIWHAFASNLGVIPVGVIPVVVIVLLVLAVLAVANVLAIAPALFASRSKPQELLRTQ
jgi:ABC-type lipoprotein release transport system permease subunit